MTNMAYCDNVLERCEDIIKPENDDRLYRGLVLNNKMKVLLISDPMTNKSVAAMNVNIGYMCDPDELPGLAHFCKRMLLLGTKKYPEENDYKKYLWQNGGKITATTYFDHTMYCFEVNPTKLTDALDRLFQFFVAPLFTDSMIKHDLEVIQAEHLVKTDNDIWRFSQLERSSANPRHPYSKFYIGNKRTLDVLPKQLGIDIRQKVVEFYEKYYSANVMSLCVLGAETLDKLEEMVVSLFGQVRNKEIDIPCCSEPPFDDEHFRTIWYIVPLQDIKNLRVVFPISDLQVHYQTAPIYYVMNLLEREGDGSLSSALKRRGWLNFLFCLKHIRCRSFQFLIFELDLTKNGLKHVGDIITLIFRYIYMLKKHGPMKWIYNEYRDLAELNFHFTHKQESRCYVSSRAFELWNHSTKKILCGDVLFPPWNPESIYLINTIMKSLTPRNIRVHVAARKYKDVAVETEPWYGIKYKKEKIPTNIIDMWENAGLNSEFHLPERNEFIPSRFDLKPRDDKVEKFPTIIADTSFVRLWFKQDDKYLVPKAKMFFRFTTPYVQLDAINFVLTAMYSHIIQNSLTEYQHFVDLGGLHWSLKYTLDGLILSIQGFDDKQHVLLEKILDHMLNLKIDLQEFEILKKDYIKNLRKYDVKRSHYPVISYLDHLLVERSWTKCELLHATGYLTADRVQAFIPQLFSKMHVECLIHGNMIKKEALDISRMIESKLKKAMPHMTPLWQPQLMIYREIKIDDGCHFLFQTENKFYRDSCTGVYYQTAVQSIVSNMLLDLLTCIINEACSNILEIEEKFGSVVFCGIHLQYIMQGLVIIVRSDKHPRCVEERIDSFIDSMLDYISSMRQEKFDRLRYSLLNLRFSKPDQLYDRTNKFWSEITTQVYNFDRKKKEALYLQTITREEILDFFKKYIHGPNRRKLSLHLLSTVEDNDKSKKEKDEFSYRLATGQIIMINDITTFKRSQHMCSVPEQFVQYRRKRICSTNL